MRCCQSRVETFACFCCGCVYRQLLPVSSYRRVLLANAEIIVLIASAKGLWVEVYDNAFDMHRDEWAGN